MTATYVAGFMTDGQRVALIEKHRPPALAGRLNGIGGKVENWETPELAMVREFEEETGFHHEGWLHFCTLRVGADKCEPVACVVYFYYTFVFPHALNLVHSTTDEPVELVSIAGPAYAVRQRALPNVNWLLAMALSMERGERARAFDITELY